MQLIKILKFFSISIPILSIVPFANIIKNNQNIITKKMNVNVDYNFSPIENFTYVYDNESVDLKFDLQNKFEKISYTLTPMEVSIHNDAKSYMTYLSNNLIKNIDDQNIKYFANDLKNGEYKIENNKYIANLSKTKKQYKVKISCGKKHSRMNLNCKENHMHMRGCFKTILYPCPGCLDGIEEVSFDKIYDLENFDKYLKNNAIMLNDFDFSNILQINYSKSYKSFDKNVLSFSINKKYLESIILGSFNYAYATKFFNENKYIKDEIKHLLSSAIYLNKLIVFDHEIPNFFGFNNKNIDEKHNLRYWIENIENFTYLELKNELNNLNELSFSKYLNDKNIDIKNPYIGKTLFNLFSDQNKLKNIIFNIDYLLGNNINTKKFSVSIYDLFHENSNKIIYEFKDQIDSHLFDNQKITIIGNTISSLDNNLIYVQNHKLGINKKDSDNLDKTVKLDRENKIIFNEKLNFANLIKLNLENNNLETYLKNNNIFEKPSKNINENVFRLLTKFNKIISFKDSNISNNIPSDVNNFQNAYFKTYIKSYELIPNDLIGSMKVIINFNDLSTIKFDVYGFNKTNSNDFKILRNNINMSKLNIDKIEIINKNYIESNLINYTNKINENSLFEIPLSKDFFQKNIEYSLITKIDDQKNANIELKYSLNNNNYVLSSKITNDLHIENKNKLKNKNSLLILIPFLIIILVIISIGTYIVIKKKKAKK